MSTVFTGLLIAGLIALVAVLLLGVFSMARGGAFNRKYSNKMMQLRVLLQFALVVIILMMFLTSGD